MEAAVAHASPEYLRLARRAKLVSWASLAYMAPEGLVAVAAGIVAGSIALKEGREAWRGDACCH